MANIAYVDHSFHRQTVSSAFIPEILQRHGCTVTFYWDESWDGGQPVFLNEILHHDVIIIFQNLPAFTGKLGPKHPNIIFVPMLDFYSVTAKRGFDYSTYFRNLSGVKFLNFSKSFHYVCQALGLYSQYYQYFQKPQVQRVVPEVGLHGFFWCRRPSQIGWETVRKLINGTVFDSFHLHLVPDPGESNAVVPTQEEKQRHNITISTGWFPQKSDYEYVLGKANVFFAPRLEEGIGQATLEALSRGQCVVAPDNGTMNEYISKELTGLLYDPEAPEPLDFSYVNLLGKQAFRFAEKGYQAWSGSEEALVDYLLTPSAPYYSAMPPRAPLAPGSIMKYVSQIPMVARYAPYFRALMAKFSHTAIP